jgi:hypothetical protein
MSSEIFQDFENEVKYNNAKSPKNCDKCCSCFNGGKGEGRGQL